jgi:RNA polymerase sigma-70 factor, ECF subfamily
LDTNREQLTVQLRKAAAGDPHAQDEVFRRLEPEIKNIARGLLRRESNAQSMQTTMLADDAFLKFVGDPRGVTVQDQRHFFRLIAIYVRQLLVDAARRRRTRKRGEGVAAEALDGSQTAKADQLELLLQLTDALDTLALTNPKASEAFQMREVLRVNRAQVATVLEVSEKDADDLYRFAAAWLKRELSDGE